MSSEKLVRSVLKIPDWYVLTPEEIERFELYIVEAGDNREHIYWSITLDCAAFCNGCYFCDAVEQLCTCSTNLKSRAD